jgi:hypothetical protein
MQTIWNETRFLPNRKLLSEIYRPPQSELPAGEVKALCFDFANVTALDTAEQSLQFDRDYVCYAVLGTIFNTADSGATFRLQLFQSHPVKHPTTGEIVKSITRPIFNKHTLNTVGAGTAQLPNFMRQTLPIPGGDSMLCEVKSLSVATAANSRIQVVLWGIEL